MAGPVVLRRTRFVCVSDTHNCPVKLPKGDVLVHAGDLTNQGSYSELSKAVKWLEAADFEAKIVVAGNHDITLDSAFYSQHGQAFHNKGLQSHSHCLSLLTDSPSITYLCHSAATVRLSSPAGPRTGFTVFGSPYSPRCGLWAFGYDAPAPPCPAQPTPWDCIPLATHVVVTHTPPRGHCDQGAGCEALSRALERVRPRMAICGHIHDGRGAQGIEWPLDTASSSSPGPRDKCLLPWTDPGIGNNKLSLVNLCNTRASATATAGTDARALAHDDAGAVCGPDDDLGLMQCHGKSPTAQLGRRQTWVINAAIIKSRYPHKGGKQFYKPMVVDVDLPVWAEGGESGMTRL
ncbi:hypothetical protein CDD82_7813 [Ophiocordyceps australis]|uniref:Calcineurin-like phosphoesterase domain-containing protein n=1 Tax=Ophiocordyceps australis TaxID=1399860 RepID=A0A2C5YPB8_9HYPO|nr:hypothetical protein CDD82_7813 [Ophiocordyceps australis]